MWRYTVAAVAIGLLAFLWARWNRKIDGWIKDANADYAALRLSADGTVKQAKSVAHIEPQPDVQRRESAASDIWMN